MLCVCVRSIWNHLQHNWNGIGFVRTLRHRFVAFREQNLQTSTICASGKEVFVFRFAERFKNMPLPACVKHVRYSTGKCRRRNIQTHKQEPPPQAHIKINMLTRCSPKLLEPVSWLGGYKRLNTCTGRAPLSLGCVSAAACFGVRLGRFTKSNATEWNTEP